MHNPSLSHVARYALFLMVCTLMWSCNTAEEKPDEQELALYNAVIDQLAWQCEEACSHPDGYNTSGWSNRYADSVKNSMRELPDRRVLHYQRKVSGKHKVTTLSDWVTVELPAWDRFYSTFGGTKAKDVLPSLTVSPNLDAGALRLDYMNIVQLDTASRMPADSSSTVIRFSKPAYHKNRHRALLYFESTCGSKRGRGELLMLWNKDSRWVIEERRTLWVR